MRVPTAPAPRVRPAMPTTRKGRRHRVWPAPHPRGAPRDDHRGAWQKDTPNSMTIEPNKAAAELAADAPVRPDSPTFAELGARAETVAALAEVGILRSFAIQEYAIPIAMRGTDLIGQAPTGTGKTLGFGIPLLERVRSVADGADGAPQALVVVPTRELCLQVARDIAAAGKTRSIRVLPIYGGGADGPQTHPPNNGGEIRARDPAARPHHAN